MNRVKLASTKKGIDKLQGLRCKYATIDEWLLGDIREDVCRGRRLSDEDSQAALTKEQIEQQKVIHDMEKYLDRENK